MSQLAVDYVQKYSMTVSDYSHDMKVDPQTATCWDSVKVRTLATIQLIISVLALPIVLIVGLITAIVRPKNDADESTLGNMVNYLKWHVLFSIPSSAVKIFTPLTTSEEISSNLLKNFHKSIQKEPLQVILEEDEGMSAEEQNRIVEAMLKPSKPDLPEGPPGGAPRFYERDLDL